MAFRLLAGVAVLLFAAFGAGVLLTPARIPPRRATADFARLLDRLEYARELDSPWIRAFRRSRTAPAPLVPDWEGLGRDAAVTVEAVTRPDREFVVIRSPGAAPSLHLRWGLPLEAGREYRVRIDVAIPLDDRGWAHTLTPESFGTTMQPSVRFANGRDARNPVGAAALRCEVQAAALGDEPTPDLTADDPLVGAKRVLDRLFREMKVGPEVEAHLAATARRKERVEVWLEPVYIRFTVPEGRTGATLGLDVNGLPGPLPLRWECARVEPGSDILLALPGSYRYARTHGETVFLKRMVETPTDHRLSLVMAPPTVVGFDVEFPRSAELRFGLKAEPPLDRSATPAASRLVIEVDLDSGQRIRLHEETVTPLLPGRPAVWAERRIPCLAAANRAGRLRFRVEAGAPGRGVVVALSDPVLHRPCRGREMPSVLLLTVDSLRYDALGRTVNGRRLTPNLDAFSEQSVRVSHAVTCGLNTFVAMPGLMAGRPLIGLLTELYAQRVRVGVPTLAEVLAGSGRFVHAVTPDFYHHNALKGFHRRFLSESLLHQRVVDAELVEEAVTFLEAFRDEPFFLWLHLNDPHQPFLPRPEDAPTWDIPGVADPGPEDPLGRFRAAVDVQYSEDSAVRIAAERYLREAYWKEVPYADAEVGAVLAKLRELGLEKNTIVAIHADHGLEAGGEKFGWRGFDDGTIRIPLLVRYPGHLPAGVERRGVMSLVDLAPTLVELAGARAPLEWSARSRVAWLRGEEPISREPGIFSGGWAVARSLGRAVIRTRDWWYLADLSCPASDPRGELRDRRQDSDDRTDLSARYPEVVRTLDRRVRDAVDAGAGGFGLDAVPESALRFLREVGYLPTTGKEKRD